MHHLHAAHQQCNSSLTQTQLDNCLHQFCIRCIKKWSKVNHLLMQTKNTCPLCRERFRSLRYRNKTIEVAQPIQSVRPSVSWQTQATERRIILVPVFVYSAANCFIYPGSGGYVFGQGLEEHSGVSYPMNTSFFIPQA